MTYEYACTACGHHWEAQQRISEAPLSTCPACAGATAKRQISGGAGFILKGGGWYSDLYASSKKDGGSTEAKGESKTESKAACSSDSPCATCPNAAAS